MTWPTDEAKRSLMCSILTFKDICGGDALIHFLEQELTRERVLKERPLITAQNQNVCTTPDHSVGAAFARYEQTIARLVDALEFYARQEGYGTAAPNQLRVEADGGYKARRALATIVRVDVKGEKKS